MKRQKGLGKYVVLSLKEKEFLDLGGKVKEIIFLILQFLHKILLHKLSDKY